MNMIHIQFHGDKCSRPCATQAHMEDDSVRLNRMLQILAWGGSVSDHVLRSAEHVVKRMQHDHAN